jgi:hypothetical protein
MRGRPTLTKGLQMDDYIDDYKEALDKMYKLGYEHGYEMAKKDIEIERLKKEVEEQL